MKSNYSRNAVLALAAGGALTFGLLGSHASASASAQVYGLTNVGPYGGEPSIVSDTNGVLYDTTPSGGTLLYRSTDGGASWQARTTADPASGDTCVTTDQSNAVYECNLAGTNTAPLQADVFKSIDQGQTWTKGINTVSGNGNTCGGSCQAFGVDRQWTTAWVPPGANAKSRVVLMYHDFYGPSQIWVNVSNDGGKTYGASQDVLLNPAATPASATGTGTAQLYSECNTVPTGIQTVQSGPHAGRIIVSWIAADAAQNLGGCNISQAESFHSLWVAWSDDGGVTWTPQMAFDAGVGHDASSPFASFTIDSAGNPYIGFVNNLNANPATCFAESTAGTVQTDTSCESDMYVVWSPDGGITWDGGGGLVPGSAATPYRVNPVADTGTHWFPAIAVGAPGQVDVAYLHTPEILPTDQQGKADPGACAGNATPNPSTFPPTCSWQLFAGQSLNLTSPPASATWTTSQLTTTPMHIGDICNLGIACGPTSNRNLLDFISETLDPQGCAHIAYSDDNTVNMLRVANQTAGCLAAPVNVPEAPLAAALIGGAAAVAWLGVRTRRRGRLAVGV